MRLPYRTEGPPGTWSVSTVGGVKRSGNPADLSSNSHFLGTWEATIDPILYEALNRYLVAEPTDGSDFRRKARLLASLWREAGGLAPGAHEAGLRDGTPVSRVLGSRLPLDGSRRGANFLSPAILRQVEQRLARPEPHELIQRRRLWTDLLSSQPMCFNLLGELAADLELATRVARAWWPGRVGRVDCIRFEWSPGRLNPRYLGNRTAFDAVVVHTTPAGGRGFIGIETKYHERADRPRPVAAERLRRPLEVADRSGVFRAGWREELTRSDLRQIWLDHLLALSMVDEWDSGLFVLMYPAANTSMASAARRYERALADPRTFEHRTLEELVGILRTVTDARWVAAFADRYLDFEKLRILGVSPPTSADAVLSGTGGWR